MAILDINNGTKRFEVNDGELLINALSSQGIHLPSACGSSGKCGLCKVQVFSSDLHFTDSEMHLLSEQERTAGMHLSCQVVLRDTAKIKIPEEFLTSQEYTAIVSKKRLLTYDIMELTLELIKPSTIAFHPGQYILFKSPAYDDKKGVMRPFSIASSSSDNTFIQLNTRLNPEGVCTPWIFNHCKEGQQIQFLGPKGSFYIKNTTRPILFIAGGSGMAPVRSILRTMNHYKINRKVLFFFGALTQKDLFYVDEMNFLEQQMSDFKFIPALSNEPLQSDWKGARGLITDAVDLNLNGDASEYEAYLCGKPAMIQACISVLEKKNIPSERAYFDLFNIAKTPK